MCGGLHASCLSFGSQVKVRPVIVLPVPSTAKIVDAVARQKRRHALMHVLRHVGELVHNQWPVSQMLLARKMDIKAQGNADNLTPTCNPEYDSLPHVFA